MKFSFNIGNYGISCETDQSGQIPAKKILEKLTAPQVIVLACAGILFLIYIIKKGE